MVIEGSHREALDGAPDTERWTIDGERSRLTFHLRHIVVQRIQGEFRRWGGTLFVNRREPWLSSVHIWVDLGSIDTNDADRDAHVLSNEFLDVAHHPRAEFKSDSVAIESGAVVIEGRLDLHGVMHDVQIHAHAGPLTVDNQGRQRATYTARGVLDRQAFGLHWNQDLDVGGVVVGDEVEIHAEIELVRHNGHHHAGTH
jgi:polyisoprenoid-binding protein YceI